MKYIVSETVDPEKGPVVVLIHSGHLIMTISQCSDIKAGKEYAEKRALDTGMFIGNWTEGTSLGKECWVSDEVICLN